MKCAQHCSKLHISLTQCIATLLPVFTPVSSLLIASQRPPPSNRLLALPAVVCV